MVRENTTIEISEYISWMEEFIVILTTTLSLREGNESLTNNKLIQNLILSVVETRSKKSISCQSLRNT